MKAIDLQGTIKVYKTIPSVWNNVHNYNSVNNADQQYTDGWRDLVDPPYDPSTHKLSPIYFDPVNDIFTKEVIALTIEEQQEYTQRMEDSDQASMTHQDHKRNGVVAFDRAISLIFRRFRNGNITGAQAKAFTDAIYPEIEPLYKGIWQLVKFNLNTATPPSNSELLDIFNIIKTKVDSYVDQNF